MPPRFSQSKLNTAARRLRRATNDLQRYGQQLKSAGRNLDRKSRQARSQLRQLPRSQPRVSVHEDALLTSVRVYVADDPVEREHDVFLSHASLDADIARELHDELEALGADVWMDDFSIKLGQNFVRTIDRGIASARVGVVLVTPSVIAGRYWVEKEFSVLLNSKETVIPVLHEVSWSDLAAYSPDLVRRDDFDGAELSTSWAVYDGPGHADNGIRSPEQVTVGNGVVRITGAPDGTTARHGVAAGAAARPLEAPARFPSRLTSPRRQDPRSRPECA